jgi:lysophospholipid acyltransferase (LPLAT)-like uncharacterized protein
MKIRAHWLLCLLGLAGAGLIRLWISTVRRRTFFAEGVQHPTDVRKERCIYAFWHETILFPASFNTRIHVLISRHRDGELIAQVCRFLGFRVARGSTTRGGASAVLELHRHSKKTHLAVTPDGPRGPRRRVQPGVIYLASVTGLPIVACGVGFSRAWRARSWDRFAVPKPWSLAVGVVAPAVHVPRRLDRDGLERYRLLVEEQLTEATAAAERWALGGPCPARDVAKIPGWQRQIPA